MESVRVEVQCFNKDKSEEYVRGLDNTTLLNNFFGFSVDTSTNMSDSDDPEFK